MAGTLHQLIENSAQLKRYYLNAGEMIFGRGRSEVHTLLGSCIAIVLWHPELHYCGVCHFALPAPPKHMQPQHHDARYGEHCVAIFKKLAEQRHTQLAQYQAKIFGGGNMLLHHPPAFNLTAQELTAQRRPIGDNNAASAFALLMEHGVEILVADVGECGYRKIVVDTSTAEVRVKFRQIKPLLTS